jgi:hydroxymethylglutaryl-CoA lyase
MTRQAQIRIVEVGPRDGLQNEARTLSVAQRVALVSSLADAGLRTIEAGSFVSKRHVPQLVDTAQVLADLSDLKGVALPVLVPNLRGFDAARDAGAEQIAVFASASETFSRRNINRSIAESLQHYGEIVSQARAAGMTVRGYVSCVLGCPFEGRVPLAKVVAVAGGLIEMGCEEVSLGDTIGVGTPDGVRDLVVAVAAEIGVGRVALHCHDTYGQALANVLACLDLGVSVVDSSVSGLGGCPYAPGASGNLATEDLVYMLDGLGVATGVDLVRLATAGREVCTALGTAPRSRTALALAARREREEASCSMPA